MRKLRIPASTARADVLDRVREPAQAAQLAEVAGAVGRARVRTDAVSLARADEERHLDAGFRAGDGHLAQLGLGEQHRAAALRDAVDHDPVLARGVSSTASSTRRLSTLGISTGSAPRRGIGGSWPRAP